MKFNGDGCENEGLYMPGTVVLLTNAESLPIGKNDCYFIMKDIVFYTRNT